MRKKERKEHEGGGWLETGCAGTGPGGESKRKTVGGGNSGGKSRRTSVANGIKQHRGTVGDTRALACSGGNPRWKQKPKGARGGGKGADKGPSEGLTVIAHHGVRGWGKNR